MSRDSGAHGVQVVGGSNPPCPTKTLPTHNKLVNHPPARTPSSSPHSVPARLRQRIPIPADPARDHAR